MPSDRKTTRQQFPRKRFRLIQVAEVDTMRDRVGNLERKQGVVRYKELLWDWTRDSYHHHEPQPRALYFSILMVATIAVLQKFSDKDEEKYKRVWLVDRSVPRVR